jgi:hypothetical protein
MKPSFLNLFMKKLIRERVVPIIPAASARTRWEASFEVAIPCHSERGKESEPAASRRN